MPLTIGTEYRKIHAVFLKSRFKRLSISLKLYSILLQTGSSRLKIAWAPSRIIWWETAKDTIDWLDTSINQTLLTISGHGHHFTKLVITIQSTGIIDKKGYVISGKCQPCRICIYHFRVAQYWLISRSRENIARNGCRGYIENRPLPVHCLIQPEPIVIGLFWKRAADQVKIMQGFEAFIYQPINI